MYYNRENYKVQTAVSVQSYKVLPPRGYDRVSFRGGFPTPGFPPPESSTLYLLRISFPHPAELGSHAIDSKLVLGRRLFTTLRTFVYTSFE